MPFCPPPGSTQGSRQKLPPAGTALAMHGQSRRSVSKHSFLLRASVARNSLPYLQGCHFKFFSADNFSRERSAFRATEALQRTDLASRLAGPTIDLDRDFCDYQPRAL